MNCILQIKYYILSWRNYIWFKRKAHKQIKKQACIDDPLRFRKMLGMTYLIHPCTNQVDESEG